jgi:hypothetical protein
MILDVARHKFYEGFATLLLTTLILIVLLAIGVGEEAAWSAPASPVMSLLDQITFGIPFLNKALAVLLYATGVLSLSRATIRTHIYPADTLASMALCAVMTLPMVVGEYALREALIVLLMGIALGHMFYCYRPRFAPRHLFTTMLAAGLLPAVEASLVVVPIAIAIALIAARKRMRDALIVITAMLLPLFSCFYILWLMGEGFADSAIVWWHSITEPIEYHILDSISIARLCFLAFALFLQCIATLFQLSHRDTSTAQARGAWRALHLIFVIVACGLIFMPSASDSMITVATVITSAMLPAFFVCNGFIISTISYTALFALAFAAAL